MMRALTLAHRWLGVPFCLLFAMWFASGIVMHFVPFPTLSEADRIDGLAPLEAAGVLHGPREAVAASGIADAARIRLVQRSDGPVYVVAGGSQSAALHADDLGPAAVRSANLALGIAIDQARRRGLDASGATVTGSARYDQWTLGGEFDRHRPLWKVALDDSAGTELYVSSVTGEVVQATTRRARWWNYAGSIAHWIYPTVLRSRPAAWSATLWIVSLAASFTALLGAVLGCLRLAPDAAATPYRGWHAWHHRLGLACATFVLTWIFSGWLSMDDGWLFSSGKPTAAEAAIVSAPAWDTLRPGAPRVASADVREVEWFFFDRKPYRRDRMAAEAEVLSGDDDGATTQPRTYLEKADIDGVARRLGDGCTAARIDPATDAYPTAPSIPGAPVYRVACGGAWLHIDGASGAVVERLDASRRAHRWLFDALHRLDVPYLTTRPALRAALIVVLCACGFAFSVTGCAIAWRRVRQWIGRKAYDAGETAV
jgi:hypothetical protein